MEVRVIRGGPLCTVQDLGRTGGRRAGLAPGGAMDRMACLWANYLLGNPPDAAVLEVTLGGTALEFSQATTVGLTGADLGASVAGKPLAPWRSHRLEPGQTLQFGYGTEGARAYLSVPGGLHAERWLGSASTVVREGLPGLLGRPLQPGDLLKAPSASGSPPPRRVPPQHVPGPEPGPESELNAALVLPLVPAYEWEQFSERDRERVFDEEWTIDAQSDRVACRLSGPSLLSGPAVLDSVPLVDGTVQVPGDGQPLVFMRDRPTIGGYAKLGSVHPAALDRLAQAQPGTPIRFRSVQADALLPELRKRERFERMVLDRAESQQA